MNQQTRVRRVAVLAAGALASTTLATTAIAVTSTPANAAPATGSFDWEISQQFDNHLSTHDLADGATEDEEGVVSFPAVSSSLDPTTGAGTVQYDGSVKGAFINGETSYYWVKLDDPAVTVDAEGEGEITAVVSAWNAAAMGSGEASTSPARVVVTTFDAADKWSTGEIAATPDWADVLAPGSEEAVALGITDPARPVGGKSFAPSFLGQITNGLRAHFHWTTGSDAKAPSAFTANYVGVPGIAATTSYSKQTASVKVDGTGFTGTDGNPGDDGVYVGLAPAGGLPDTSSQEDMDKFVIADWIPAAAIVDGAISTTLRASADQLDKGTSYAVYTWRAHGHSSTSQDSETAVPLSWSKLTAKSKVVAKVTKKPTTKKAGKLSVAVKGGTLDATGQVKVTLKKGKATKTKKATVKKGAAKVTLPKLKPGKWRVTVAYASANDAYSNDKKVLNVKVAKPKKSKKR